MQRIEFFFFDAGGGHRAAATALEMSIKAQGRPWDVRLTNLQELLDELDILKRYAGIRIEDYYNWMLRSGWTLGSVQLMKVLQFAIRMRIMLRRCACWSGIGGKRSRTWLCHSCRTSIARFVKVSETRIQDVHSLRYLRTSPITLRISGSSASSNIWCAGRSARWRRRASMGHADERIFRASGMILHPRFYEPPIEDPVAERVRLGLRPDLPTAIVLVRRVWLESDAGYRGTLGRIAARIAVDLHLRAQRKAG